MQAVRRLTLPSSGPAYGGPLKSNVRLSSELNMHRRTFNAATLSMVLACRPARAASAIAALSGAGVTFSIPKGWITEDYPDGQALSMMLLDATNSVDASMMVELFSDDFPQSPEVCVEQMAHQRRRQHPAFRELERGMGSTAVGLTYAFIRYEIPRYNTPFLEQYIVMPVTGSTRVNVFASFDKSSSGKFLPVVSQFIQSVRITT